MPLALPRFAVKSFNPRQPRDRLGRWTSTPGGGLGRRERPTIGDLIPAQPPDNRRVWKANQLRAAEGVAKAVDGEYAGFAVTVNQRGVQVDTTKLSFAAGIKLGSKAVGDTAYEFMHRDDQLVAEFLLLSLHEDAQGQGFAGRFVPEMEQWCWDSGVAYIGLDAGLSGGGYTWASRGYDWWDHEQAGVVVIPRLTLELGGLTATLRHLDPESERGAWLLQQLTVAQDVLDRLRGAQFGSVEYPTPYEVSQAGRRPGQASSTNPQEWWIGKTVMMGSRWRGVKRR